MAFFGLTSLGSQDIWKELRLSNIAQHPVDDFFRSFSSLRDQRGSVRVGDIPGVLADVVEGDDAIFTDEEVEV